MGLFLSNTEIKYEKAKVYTALDVDAEHKLAGAKGFFSDTFDNILKFIKLYNNGSWDSVDEVDKVLGIIGTLDYYDTSMHSWRPKEFAHKIFDFFYLLEDPPLIQERPFKDVEEFVQVYTKRWSEHMNNINYIDPMSHPTIWIREIDTKKDFMVVGMDENSITIIDTKQECVGEMIFGGHNPTRTVLLPTKIDMSYLASRFTFLDGTGCIVREKI